MISLLQLHISVLRAHFKVSIIFVLSRRPGRLTGKARLTPFHRQRSRDPGKARTVSKVTQLGSGGVKVGTQIFFVFV